jgi:hypothetical protein
MRPRMGDSASLLSMVTSVVRAGSERVSEAALGGAVSMCCQIVTEGIFDAVDRTLESVKQLQVRWIY